MLLIGGASFRSRAFFGPSRACGLFWGAPGGGLLLGLLLRLCGKDVPCVSVDWVLLLRLMVNGFYVNEGELGFD